MAEIEMLTNRDRAALDSGLCEGGRKALRIIDAHASDRAALVEQVQLARAELECARRERDTWRSLCETAERSRDAAAREMSRCHRLWQEDAAKLVAANTLLEYIATDAPDTAIGEVTMRRICVQLSSRPAAPSEPESDLERE